MLFTSVDFVLFLPIVFSLYWFSARDLRTVFSRRLQLSPGAGTALGSISSEEGYESGRSIRFQNILILVASYVFYGWWDWRFLSLIAFSSLMDYVLGIQMHDSPDEKRRKILLGISLAVNLGLLGFFKYYNFFVSSFVDAFASIGILLNVQTLSIILPVGISFYTFQTLSYTIDIYRRQLEPTRNPVNFFAFVSFFPQLVAGPIERASHLLPQFERKRVFRFEQAKDGLRQMLWGLFKKIVIADNCGIYVNQIYEQSDTLTGSVLLLGAIYFSFQVYCDFSGYSDIAIGVARLFGFHLKTNFHYPFFSTSIGELWNRWHMSLNTWFGDYVYKPMAMSFRSLGSYTVPLCIFLTFTLSGLWHGASYTCIMWGVVMGIGLVIETQSRKRRKRLRKKVGKRSWNFMGWLATMSIFVFSVIYFRSTSIEMAHSFIGNMFSWELLNLPQPLSLAKFAPWLVVLYGIEWIQRDHLHPLHLDAYPRWLRWLVYYVLLYLISNYGISNQSFIYFQF